MADRSVCLGSSVLLLARQEPRDFLSLKSSCDEPSSGVIKVGDIEDSVFI